MEAGEKFGVQFPQTSSRQPQISVLFNIQIARRKLPGPVIGIDFSYMWASQRSNQKLTSMTPDITLKCPNLEVSAWNLSQKP
jgi:hypothetical protein